MQRKIRGWLDLCSPLSVLLSVGIAGISPYLAERLTSGAFVMNLSFQTEVLMWAPAETGANVPPLKNLMSSSQNKSSSCEPGTQSVQILRSPQLVMWVPWFHVCEVPP